MNAHLGQRYQWLPQNTSYCLLPVVSYKRPLSWGHMSVEWEDQIKVPIKKEPGGTSVGGKVGQKSWYIRRCREVNDNDDLTNKTVQRKLHLVRLWIAILKKSSLPVQPARSSQHHHHQEPRLSNYPCLVILCHEFRVGEDWGSSILHLRRCSEEVKKEQGILDG